MGCLIYNTRHEPGCLLVSLEFGTNSLKILTNSNPPSSQFCLYCNKDIYMLKF